jgi:hypothetical protein
MRERTAFAAAVDIERPVSRDVDLNLVARIQRRRLNG